MFKTPVHISLYIAFIFLAVATIPEVFRNDPVNQVQILLMVLAGVNICAAILGLSGQLRSLEEKLKKIQTASDPADGQSKIP
jgi:hypothetical protein